MEFSSLSYKQSRAGYLKLLGQRKQNKEAKGNCSDRVVPV
jgi:hypothetical protein